MNRAIRMLMALALASFVSLWHPVQAQTAQRTSDEQVKHLLARIERGADSFKSSLKDALAETHFASTRAEDNVNSFVAEFETATNRLKERFNDRNAATSAVDEVLKRAAALNNFMARYPLSTRAQNDWEYLRTNLNELARVYNVVWVWPGVTATRPYRVNDQQMEALLKRIEEKSDSFRAALKSSLEQTRFDETKAEDNINQFVRDFERAADQLEERYDDDFTTTGAATEVLRRAVAIEGFMQRHKLTPSSQSAWQALRGELNELAKAYNFALDWRAPTLIIQFQPPAEQGAGSARKP